MKGLLLKDAYMAAKYCRAYLLVVAVFMSVSLFSDDNMFLLFYPVLLSSVIPVNLIAYDEKSGWSVYSGAMPYTRRQLVSVKYLVVLIILAAGVALTALIRLARMLYTGEVSGMDIAIMIAPLAGMGLVIPSLLLPVVFKFGVEKGRMLFYILLVIIGAMVGVFVSAAAGSIAGILSAAGNWLIPATLAGGALLLTGSWLLSIRFYEKREL